MEVSQSQLPGYLHLYCIPKYVLLFSASPNRKTRHAMPSSVSGSLWPQPMAVASGDVMLTLPAPAGFLFSSTPPSPLLEHAFRRYRRLIFSHHDVDELLRGDMLHGDDSVDGGEVERGGVDFGGSPGAHDQPAAAASTRRQLRSTSSSAPSVYAPDAAHCILNALSIQVADGDESHPQLKTDEEYTLTIPECGQQQETTRSAKSTSTRAAVSATVTAQTVYGALRALETFSQLVRFDFDARGYVLEGAPWAISDKPRFAHRGVMVDTGRSDNICFLSLPKCRTPTFGICQKFDSKNRKKTGIGSRCVRSRRSSTR